MKVPFALSLSKGDHERHKGFDKLSPNGCGLSSLVVTLQATTVRRSDAAGLIQQYWGQGEGVDLASFFTLPQPLPSREGS